MIRLTKAQAARHGIDAKPTKYSAVKTTVDGITFHSKKEARRYSVLKALEAEGQIADLQLQPSFDLIVKGGAKVGVYRADFGYTAFGDRRVIEDCKGMKTPVYKLKKKMVEAIYGIKILET